MLDRVGGQLDRPGDLVVFVRGHEAQMSFGKETLGNAADGAQYGQATSLFDGLAQHGLVPSAGRTVEDDSAKQHVGIEFLTTQDQRGDRPCRLGAVNGEHDRGLQQLGQFGRAARALGVHAVEEAPVAFDDGHLGTRASRRE